MVIDGLSTQMSSRADGCFTVAAPPVRVSEASSNLHDIYTIMLRGESGTAECRYIPALPEKRWMAPAPGEEVTANLVRKQDDFGVWHWRVKRFVPVNAEPILRPIPWEQCPRPKWISALGFLIDRRIQSQAIEGFLQGVFREREIMDPFLRFGASAYVHHSQAGGLFEHSVSAAVSLSEIADETTSRLERDCCIVGMLFHDIGKIVPRVSKTGLLRSKDHPYLIGPILSDALERLRQTDRHAWEVMHYVFGVIAGIYDDSRIPLTKFIRTVDQYHAAEDARRRAWSEQPRGFGCITAPTGQVYFREQKRAR